MPLISSRSPSIINPAICVSGNSLGWLQPVSAGTSASNSTQASRLPADREDGNGMAGG